MAKTKTTEPETVPAVEPARVRVRMRRVLRIQEAPNRLPEDIAGEREVEPHIALAWTLLGYAVPLDEQWSPTPSLGPAAAVEALRWFDGERGTARTDEMFSRVPANARRLESVLALVAANDGIGGGEAA